MYGNRDFTTAKGFSFQYDMRRTGNVMVNAQYSSVFCRRNGFWSEFRFGFGSLRTTQLALHPAFGL